MNIQLRILIATIFIFVTVTQSLHAQLVADGATNTLNNSTNTIPGDLIVGTNGSFTLLGMTNNALLTNGANGVIGLNTGAKSNAVQLLGPGTRWLMGNHLYVGSNGSFNRLLVSNGSTVQNNNGYLGPSPSGSNNVAIITGSGSLWSNAGAFFLGFNGAGNQLIVSNGGVLRALVTDVAVNSGSSNNVAIVTGVGSLWTNVQELVLGFGGAGNQLLITNGGTVRSSQGYVGNGTSANNNVATVTGPGSLWTNTAELYVGLSGAGNQLVVTEGGTVRNGYGYVGANTSGSNNLALITGTGSTWSNALGLEIGSFSGNNRMIISNGATVFTAAQGIIGPTANGNANSAVVTDAGSRWILGSTLHLGSNSAFNRLLISNGGQVFSGGAGPSGTLGWNSGGSNNLVTVTGAGSMWSNANSFYLGVNAQANQLIVSNGGTMISDQSFVGSNTAASNNVATVTGPGSSWNTDGTLYFGFNGARNRLEVNNGGVIRDAASLIGVNSTSTNNFALVTDSGSLWTNEFDLRVGDVGSANQLVVSNSAAISTHEYSYIGFSTGANSNSVTVTDSGSRWDTRFNLEVGHQGAFNRLLIRNGALVTASQTIVGSTTNANTNTVLVADAGSRWLPGSNLYVGSNGALSRLVISNNAFVENGFAVLGHNASSSNNEVIVSSGSIWTNRTLFYVGGSGRGNRLVITNGGRVNSINAELADNALSSSNELIITGPGSFCHIRDSFLIGNNGNSNRVIVADGARLRDDNVHVGFFGTHNEIIVTGPGTSWTNTSGIQLGRFRGRNRLVITNSAFVFAREVYVSLDPASTNNLLLVDGGTLRVTNSTGAGALDVQRGTNILNAGLIDVTQLWLNNPLGFFEFNGGTLRTSRTTNNNGSIFVVGNGTNAATFELLGGTHVFSNNLIIVSNATVAGNGTIIGTLTVRKGSTLAPGSSVGTLFLSNSPVLQGTTLMEISRNGSALTNDQILVAGPLSYGGLLTVTNIGPTTLAAGDRFKLFDAVSYAGSFSTLSLPPLGNGLGWTNKLLLDGSIEVIDLPVPKFATIQLSGTNVIIAGTGGPSNTTYAVLAATNVASPLSNWVSIATNLFDSAGGFSFTNGIVPGIPQRFYRLRWP